MYGLGSTQGSTATEDAVVNRFYGLRRKVDGHVWLVKSTDQQTFTDILDTGYASTAILYIFLAGYGDMRLVDPKKLVLA